MPPLQSIGFVPKTSAHMFGMFYGGTRNAHSFVQTTWRNAARTSKMIFGCIWIIIILIIKNKNSLVDWKMGGYYSKEHLLRQIDNEIL